VQLDLSPQWVGLMRQSGDQIEAEIAAPPARKFCRVENIGAAVHPSCGAQFASSKD
jgi:hypothetical protein